MRSEMKSGEAKIYSKMKKTMANENGEMKVMKEMKAIRRAPKKISENIYHSIGVNAVRGVAAARNGAITGIFARGVWRRGGAAGGGGRERRECCRSDEELQQKRERGCYPLFLGERRREGYEKNIYIYILTLCPHASVLHSTLLHFALTSVKRMLQAEEREMYIREIRNSLYEATASQRSI